MNDLIQNQKISNTQIKKLLIFDMLSLSIMLVPEIASVGAGRDGVLSIFLGSFAALAYAAFFLYAVHRVNGNVIDYCKETVGKCLTAVIAMLYIAKILFSCWFAFALFAKIIKDTLLPDTGIKIILLCLIFVSLYAAWKGIEVRARLAEVFFFIILVPLLLLIVLGFKRVDLTNVFPLLTESSGTILNTSYLVLLTYSAVEFLILALPGLSEQKERGQRYQQVMQSVLLVAAINIALFILVLGLLGITGAQQQFKASVMIMQLIQIPGGFVQRQDAIMLTIWMLSMFTLLSAYLYYLTYITNSVLPIKRRGYTFLFWAAVVFGLSFIQIPIETLFSYYGKYMAVIGLPQSICMPLLIGIIAKLRGKGEANEAKS